MSKRRNRRRGNLKNAASTPGALAGVDTPLEQQYEHVCRMAECGEYGPARLAYEALARRALPPRLLALVESDLGSLLVMQGDLAEARRQFERALAIDEKCAVAQANLTALVNRMTAPVVDAAPAAGGKPEAASSTQLSRPHIATPAITTPAEDGDPHGRQVRVAILSLLFNWPSTGGGTIHTAELGKFLGKAGYAVRHIYAQNADWGVGNVTADTGVPSTPLAFDQAAWNAGEIQRRFRQAVDEFAPDYVIVTDSWNFKPLLAEAVRGYRYFLRLAALECLCALNNVRLILDENGGAVGCPRHQLASPHLCGDCVMRRQHQSGSLHQAERALAGYGTAEYDHKLRQAFAEAEGVLVVNPLIAAMVEPFSSKVHVVPSGFDRERFPWPWEEDKVVGTLSVPSAAISPPFARGGQGGWRELVQRRCFRAYRTG